jgi:hypothetical protein
MKESMEKPAIKESNNSEPSMVPNLKNLMKLTFGFSSSIFNTECDWLILLFRNLNFNSKRNSKIKNQSLFSRVWCLRIFQVEVKQTVTTI